MRRTLSLLAALLALLLAPAAAAQAGQGIDLRLTLPAAPIKPQVENPAFAAEVTVPCDAVLARVSPSAPQDEIPVLVTFATQEGVVVTGPASIPLDPAACLADPAAGAVEASGAFRLSIARTVPGLEPSSGVATARLEAAPGSQPLESTVPFTVTPDAYLVSQLAVDRKLGRCEDSRARFQATVANLGNVATRYTFEVDAPGGGWRLTVPEELVLDSPLQGGGTSEATVDLVAKCPFGNEAASFQLVARTAAADDPAKEGNPLTADLAASSRVVPSPTPALLLAGLAAAALLSRRRA